MRSGVSQMVAYCALLVVLCIYSASSEEVFNYENYVILSLHPQSEKHVSFINNLDSLDIHRGAVMKGQTVEAMLSPQDFELLRRSESLPYEIKEGNVQRLIDSHYQEIKVINERERTQKRDVPATEAFFQNYRTWEDANSYILYLLGSYPTLITRQKIGESIEGRDIYVLVVTNQTSKVTAKRLVLFNSGQHAREWLAPSTVLYSLTQLLVLQNDAVVNPLLNELEFHFIPFVNPDGYVYTQTNRMWRKNRRLNSPGVYGVDTNRNWGKAFGVGSASTSASEETYEGTHPFSEPETQNVAVYIKSKDFRCHVDFHTYGLDILRRWASSNDISIDDSVMKEAGDAARDAVKAAGGSNYRSANGFVLGIDGGCMPDWTYAERGMISYTIELSAGGFVLPADKIIPTGKEGYTMIKTLARFVADGKADKDKMKWKDPNTPPPPATTTGSHPHTTGTIPPPSSSAISTADILLVFVVLFISIVAITVIIVAVKQYYSPIQYSPTYLGSALEEEGGEEDGEELSEMRR